MAYQILRRLLSWKNPSLQQAWNFLLVSTLSSRSVVIVTRSHHQVKSFRAKPGVSHPDYLEEEPHLQHYIDLRKANIMFHLVVLEH